MVIYNARNGVLNSHMSMAMTIWRKTGAGILMRNLGFGVILSKREKLIDGTYVLSGDALSVTLVDIH